MLQYQDVDQMLNDIEMDEFYNDLIRYEVADIRELNLITGINGYNMETFESVLYYRTGYTSIEQLKEEE